MRSLDGGETFEDRRPGGPRDAHTLASHDRAAGRLYAPAADGMGGGGKALMESRDGGQTWQPAGAGIGHGYGWSVAVDPSDPEHVVYSGAHSPRQAHDAAAAESALYYRHNGTWTRAQAGLPEPRGTGIYVLATQYEQPGVFYTACNHGVYVSEDAGYSWEQLDVAWPEAYRRQHVQGLAVLAA